MSSVMVVYDLWDRLFLLILAHHSLLMGGSLVYLDIHYSMFLQQALIAVTPLSHVKWVQRIAR